MSNYQVYKITNKINGLMYIGSSTNVKRRWYQHKQVSKNIKVVGVIIGNIWRIVLNE